MNKAKNILTYVVLIVTALFLTSTISAADFSELSTRVDDVNVNNNPSVVAGETVVVEVVFTSRVNDSDVRVTVEIDGDESDSEAVTDRFDVEANKTYRKNLALKVPFYLDDEVSDDTTLDIEIEGEDSSEEFGSYTLRVQRPSYNAEFLQVSTANSVKAGNRIPVDIVFRNRGYNNLDDLFVSVEVPGIGIKDTKYFGDLVSIEDDCNECDDDDEDTVMGRFYLEVPFGAKSGVYAVNVEVRNEDTTSNKVLQIAIQNDFPENLVVESSRKSVSVGEEATYELTLLNPTNDLKVYRVVTESSEDFNSEVRGSSVVAIPAGQTKTVEVSAVKDSEGENDFTVSVLSGESLTGKASLTLEAEGSSLNNPVVALTVILAIVFVVLLVVLIVLLTKRSEKSEEFGESYY